MEFTSFSYKGVVYRHGDGVYLPADTYQFLAKPPRSPKKAKKDTAAEDYDDEDLYPELYRKSEYVKGSNYDVPKPFQIGELAVGGGGWGGGG